MKRIGILSLLLILAGLLHAQKPGAIIDIQHYRFAIQLNDTNNIIRGQATIDLQMLQESKSILLDLVSQRSNGKGMKVSSVKDSLQSLSFRQSGDSLLIQFAQILPPGTSKKLAIQYEGIPIDGLIIAQNKYKHRGFFADNWPDRAHNWIPCVDHPADKASVEFIVDAPTHYQVISNGIQVEETSIDHNYRRTHYIETVPLSTKIMVIGVADFAVQRAGGVGHIPVYSWVYPEEREKGFYDYGLAVSILPYFIKHVGPFAFKKLANVQSKTIFGGMENAGAIFYSETSSINGKRTSETLLAHEIAHQWFGDMASETDWPHLWLSEGFATYMTILYMESKYGKDTANQMLINNREKVIAFAKEHYQPVVDTTLTDYMQLLNPNSYEKGGWVLHMLRQQLGDSLFWKGIRTYYARYAGKNASTGDFRKVMEEVSGKDFSSFFQQWLFTAGHPVLDITWKYDAAAKEVILGITQQQKSAFRFPLDIIIYSPNGTLAKSIDIKDQYTEIRIPMTEKPNKMLVDPAIHLLFQSTVRPQ